MEPILLPRQTTPYTCGAACLAAVARLLGMKFEEAQIAEACNAAPDIGIDNNVLAAWAAQHLPVVEHHTSLSIWNIRNPISKIGHYVLVIGERDGRVRYDDPLFCRVFEYGLNEIDWQSGCGKHKRWRINFDTRQSYYDSIMLAESHGSLPIGDPFPEFMLRSLSRYLDINSAKY